MFTLMLVSSLDSIRSNPKNDVEHLDGDDVVDNAGCQHVLWYTLSCSDLFLDEQHHCGDNDSWTQGAQ